MDSLLDSWAPLTAICGIMFIIIFGFSMLLGAIPFSIISLGWAFLFGCLIGYIVYFLFRGED